MPYYTTLLEEPIRLYFECNDFNTLPGATSCIIIHRSINANRLIAFDFDALLLFDATLYYRNLRRHLSFADDSPASHLTALFKQK